MPAYVERYGNPVEHMMLPVEIHIDRVQSTNDHAKDLLQYYPFIMITANVQTKGRGRRGRSWQSSPGKNVLCSFGIRHTLPQSTSDLSSWMGRAALAVLHAVRELAPTVPLRLKYPNDIHVRNQKGWSKICGILVEHEFLGSTCVSTIVGIGLNVQQEQGLDTISQRYTSLRDLGCSVDVPTANRVIRDAFVLWSDADIAHVYEHWQTELVALQSVVRIVGDDGDWIPRTLLNDGRLSLTDATQTRQRVVSDGDSLQYLD